MRAPRWMRRWAYASGRRPATDSPLYDRVLAWRYGVDDLQEKQRKEGR